MKTTALLMGASVIALSLLTSVGFLQLSNLEEIITKDQPFARCSEFG